MKILLLGANGQVGFELLRTLAPLGELVSATRSGVLPGGSHCEIVDLAQTHMLGVVLERVRPGLIVNAAAYTAVDRAEDEAELADQINHRALTIIGQWAKVNKATVVHYSTDYVFDGASVNPYNEAAAAAPRGVYGRSKWAGEQALVASGCDYLILRTAWVYAARGHNFLRTMLRLAKEREQINIVADQRGAPTSSRLIAAATLALLVRWSMADAIQRRALSGTYHLTASGECSWFDFAVAIFQRAVQSGLLPRPPAIVPIATRDYPTRAQRPAYSVLDTRKIQQRFGIHLPLWQIALNDVFGELEQTVADTLQ